MEVAKVSPIQHRFKKMSTSSSSKSLLEVAEVSPFRKIKSLLSGVREGELGCWGDQFCWEAALGKPQPGTHRRLRYHHPHQMLKNQETQSHYLNTHPLFQNAISSDQEIAVAQDAEMRELVRKTILKSQLSSILNMISLQIDLQQNIN